MPAKRTKKQKTTVTSKRRPTSAPRQAPAARRAAPSTTVSSRPEAASTRKRSTPTVVAPSTVRNRAQRWGLVTARDLMREEIVTVSESAPLSEVERVLSDHRIHGVPVVDPVGRIVGVVSVSDLMSRYAEDPDSRPRREPGWFRVSTEELADEDLESFEVPAEAEETAQDVMTAQIFTVPAGAGLREVADALCKHKIHRVLVEDAGRLVGLVSTMDVLEGLRA